jgi:hypothetical protein
MPFSQAATIGFSESVLGSRKQIAGLVHILSADTRISGP